MKHLPKSSRIAIFSIMVLSVLIVFSRQPHTIPSPLAELDDTSEVDITPENSVEHDSEFINQSHTEKNSPKNTPSNPRGVQDEAVLSQTPTVSSVVRERVLGASVVAGQTTYPNRTYKALLLPSDPQANQWWTTTSRLQDMWDISTGSSNITIAVIDTGFALNHEEFAGRWAENSGEVGATTNENPSQYNCSDRSLALDKSCNLIDDDYDGIVDNETGTTTAENPSQLNCTDQSIARNKSCNLVDDDGNGLADDWRGWDFVEFDRSVQAGDIDPYGSGVSHGTYVVGAAAANANNTKGIAGASWSSKVLPIKALGDSGSGNTVTVARGIRYAVERGADVINLSLGSIFADSYIHQAVQEAIGQGVIVVAAAGNDGCECLSYPANYPEVIAVGALSTTGQKASFSSYGENVDIMAPGTQVYTTAWSPTNQESAYQYGVAGTSIATPIVSGIVANLLAERPELTPLSVHALITETANKANLLGDTFSTIDAYGSIDAKQSIDRTAVSMQPQLRTALSGISYGNRLQSSVTYEPISTNVHLYTCDQPSTKVYKLVSSTRTIFTTSAIEADQSVFYGFTPSLFMSVCVSMSQDTPIEVRNLDVYREFLNSSWSYFKAR